MSPNTANTSQHCSSKDLTLLAAWSRARLSSRARQSALIWMVFNQDLPSYTCTDLIIKLNELTIKSRETNHIKYMTPM
ncbi:hypothetical protein KC19_6G210700 [Ceratodon purpureus]|uniref:Uncharacterized protein n=1 Tax=Ceratodon purpureus TaxID=3225 RepID=A0A8T0HJW9_CERPU|nr:hypothetical protein KC19_6G210700 [Ceratodon purpureus]